MNSLIQDIRFGLRTLLRSPGFTLVAVLTLAMGIGANTAIFSVVNGVLLQPLPYERGERIVNLQQPAPLIEVQNAGFSPLEIADYREQSQSLETVVEYHSMPFNLIGREEPQRVQTGVVSWNFFDMLSVRPLLGRSFAADDETHEADAVLLLSYDYWQQSFGGDPNIVGEEFEMNDRVHTVVGVLPSIPQYPNENDVYMPVTACPFRNGEGWRTTRTARGLTVFGKLGEGESLAGLEGDLSTVAGRLHSEYPEAYPETRGLETIAVPLKEQLTRQARPTLWILLGTSLLLLLIVCTNLVNLTLARHAGREQEMSIRTALGAGRGRLARQLVTEGTILALAGGAAGLLLALVTLDMLKAFAARFTTRAAEVAIDPTVLLFTLGVALSTGLVLGILPALRSRVDINTQIKSNGASSVVGSRGSLRKILVVSQVSISFVLLIGAGLMIRSFMKLQDVDPGFNPENVLTVRLDLNWSKYDNPEIIRSFADALETKLAGSAGVVSVAFSNSYPLNGGVPFTQGFEIEGEVADEGRPTERTVMTSASPAYFQTVGTRLLQGRTFDVFDQQEQSLVVVVTRSFARKYWDEGEAIGKRIRPPGGPEWMEIVGVVDDVKQFSLDQEESDMVFVPYSISPFRDMRLLLRSRGDARAMAMEVREAVSEIDPAQPLAEIQTLEEVRTESLASPRLTMMLMGLFAGLAIAITATGIGGVIAFTVSQRTSEIGLRMALGASRGSVLAMVLGQGMVLVFVGLGIGVLAALSLGRLMSGLLYNIAPTDLWTYIAVLTTLSIVAAATCLIPARRATSISPTEALRIH